MSEVRSYLEAKTETPREWLRRNPRTVHPTILELVRRFVANGGIYNDDAERFVAEHVGDLPPHRRHGHENRHPITNQLGAEIYLSRSILRDEEARETEAALLAEGFVPLDQTTPESGERCTVVLGTLYSGHEVPVYAKPRQVRIHRTEDRIAFLPKGARTRGFLALGPALIRPGW
jgi:hypothetical protein